MSAARAWAVVVTKPSGSRVVFSVHGDEREADVVASRLRQFGMTASIERAHAGAFAPGMAIKSAAERSP